MAPRETSIFLSYARKDGADLAQRLQGDLAAHGFDVWLDTRRLAHGAVWSAEIERAIDNARVVVALMSPGSFVSEICRAEQLRSLRKGKQVIPVLVRPGSDIPLHLEAKQYRDFSGAKPYAEQFQLLLEDMNAAGSAVPLRPEFSATYVTAPPLPRNYVERPEALANLRNALITDGSGASIALTALQGMGGIGKTILAQALAHDEVVQQAFPDGVIWTTVGKEPAYDLATRMREVRRALGDDLGDKESELECIDRYRTVVRNKAALIVVDDVWRTADVQPFRAESLRSRILFTTRDASIAAAFGAEQHIAGLLAPAQSRELLARWSGSGASALPGESEDILKECGGLPLAIAMIGAMLRGKPPAYWKLVDNLLRSADLARIKAQFPDYPHTDLLRAIQVSVDALDSKARERYLALAVLLEDMPIAPAIQQTLWGADELDALETAEHFVSLSLAQRDETRRDGDPGSIRLHDLQLDYVRAQHPDRQALDLIHGAVRLSTHVIDRDPRQFASQMAGRLLAHEDLPGLRQFTESVIKAAPRPWLRPLTADLTPPGGPLLRTLTGHEGYVNAVVVTPDGKQAVSASDDETLKVWDLASGREIHTLIGHTFAVRAVAATPDGKQAISASWDDTLKVWDLASGREILTLTGHSGDVSAVAVTPDGNHLVSASGDRTLTVWDLASGRDIRTLTGHSDGVKAVVVTPDGKQAVSGSWDNTLKVWDLASGQELHTLTGHSGGVYAVALTPDGQQAVSASGDQTMKVWDLSSGRELRTLARSEGVDAVAVTPDGKQAVSASYDQTLKVWDLSSGRELRTLTGHTNWVYAVAVTPDGKQAISASADHTLKMWDLTGGREPQALAGHRHSVNGVAMTPDGKEVISGSWEAIKAWDPASGHELRTVAEYTQVNGLAFTPDGMQMVSASLDHKLKVWDLASGQELRTLTGHTDWVHAAAVTPDSKYAVSASSDQTLKVWDLATGRELCTLTGHSDAVRAVAVFDSPDGDGMQAVSASEDHTLKVWDLASGRELRTLTGHSHMVTAVTVTPGGMQAVSGSYQALKLWDIASGRELGILTGHNDIVNALALTPDGKQLVSASADRTVKVWDMATETLIATFTCDAPVRCCVFAGERKIVAGDESGRLHFLELEL